MADKKRFCKLTNKGSAIITVLIVIIFVSILATTVLYLAGRNIKMKATDRHTKESFYETEKSMEEIKAGLIRIASLSYDDAYAAVMKEYAGYDAAGRLNLFNETFLNSVRFRLGITDDPDDDIGDVRSTVVSFVTDTGASVTVGSYDDSHLSSGQFFIKNVTVTDSVDNYLTEIKTDFAIICPKNVSFDFGYDTEVPASSDSHIINIYDCVLYTNWEKR